MAEYLGITYLKDKLKQKEIRNSIRYDYYEMKNRINEFNITMPKELNWIKECLGWCAKAVDSISDRLIFDSFRNDNLSMNEIYNMNNRDILFDDAILSALICSCSFIYISPDDTGYPRLQVIDGRNATGIIDPITYMLKEGYAILEKDEDGNTVIDAYFTSESTEYYRYGKKYMVIDNPTAYPLLVPVIYRPDAKRRFGHSRISRSCMGIMQATLRTLKRSEVSAEFYSFPQKYVLGTDPDRDDPLDKWKATMSMFLEFSKDSDGDRPTVGQFQQQSMSPYTEQMRTLASLFAGETGLTLNDLGFVTDNPSSAEAIKASHENLRNTARKAQRTFGVGFLNTGYLAVSLRDKYSYERSFVYETVPEWLPIFEPDAAMLSSIGDGIIKLNQAVPGYVGSDNLKRLTGIDASEEVESINGTEGEGYSTGPLAGSEDEIPGEYQEE